MNHPIFSFAEGSTLFAEAGPLLLSSNARAVGLLFLCFYLLKFARRSASFRHLLIASVLTGLLFLPLFSIVIPAIDVIVEVAHSELAVLPTQAASAGATEVSGASPWNFNDYLSCAILLYALGILVNLLRQAWANAGIFLVTCVARPVDDAHWREGLRRAKQKFSIRRPVELRYSRLISSPVTWGFLRPVILVPWSARGWSSQLVHSALLHEVAHIRRFDWLTQQIARLACALYWINPLCWRALKRLEDNAESACDDLVLNARVKGTHYASDLLQVARQVCAGGRLPSSALAMSVSSEPSQLVSRVNSILSPAVSRAQNSPSRAILTLSLTLFVVLPLASLRANYVEVVAVDAPVFAPENLTRFSGSSATREAGSGEVAGEIDTNPKPAEFNRAAVKQAAVTELRTTIAKINTTTRGWLEQTAANDAGPGKEAENDVLQLAALPPALNEVAPWPAQSLEFFDESESDLEKRQEAVGIAAAKNSTPAPASHPLVAFLNRAAQAQSANATEAYTHVRVVKPEYPRRALTRGIEGEVVVAFSIDRWGRVVDPRIVQATPAGVFDRQVLRAVEKFQFKPSLVDGRPVAVEGAREVFKFVLES
ncbi:MAG: M56 family metallopeptidase [Cellvibrionaceae bacterium]